MMKTKKEELKALKTGDVILLSDGKKAKPNPLLEEVQEIVKKYKGQSMGTVYGPSTIVGLTEDFKHVELKEFGMETYHLTLKDFLDEYNQNGIVS